MILRLLGGAALGAAFGYAAYAAAGCRGGCPITSNPWLSVCWGALLGLAWAA